METSQPKSPLKLVPAPRILIVEARYYAAINDALLKGAVAVLEAAQANYEQISVPGALEIPSAIAMAHAAGAAYEGYVALGCVIRGETAHFDIVAQQSARGLMELGVRQALAIGNGILTVENEAQALARALPEKHDIGGIAAHACLHLIAHRRCFHDHAG